MTIVSPRYESLLHYIFLFVSYQNAAIFSSILRFLTIEFVDRGEVLSSHRDTFNIRILNF